MVVKEVFQTEQGEPAIISVRTFGSHAILAWESHASTREAMLSLSQLNALAEMASFIHQVIRREFPEL